MAKNNSKGGSDNAGSSSGGDGRIVSTTSDIPIGGRPALVPSARLEADVMDWNSEGTEQPPDDNGEVVGAPIPRDANPERDAAIRELLYGKKPGPKPAAAEGEEEATEEGDAEGEAADTAEGEGEDQAAEGEETTDDAEGETDDGKPAAAKPVEPPAEVKPKRRDILASIAAERSRVSLEANLKAANARVAAAEAKVAEATAALQNVSKKPLLKLMRDRGLMTKEQALEALVAAEEEDASPADVAAAAPAMKVADPEVAALAKEVAELRQERRRATDAQANAIVRSTVQPLDLPLVNTTKRVPVPMDDGRVVYQTPEQVIIAIAEQRWIAEGSPAHIARVDYLAGAAETLEEALREEFGHTDESYAALRKRTATAADAPAAKKPPAPAIKPKVPSVGKRVAHTTTPVDPTNGLSMDRDERKQQAKARFGLL